jgi:hypothetical protein
MNSDAPSGSIDFGSGPSTEVEVSIRSITSIIPESNADYTFWILGGIGLVSLAFAISIIFLIQRKKIL